MSTESQRIPPQATDVEQTILGSMLIDSAAVVTAIEHLDEDCFYASANRIIFKCMVEMFENKIPIDIITISQQLKKKELLAAIGSEAYLSELAERVATSANIEYYAGIVREKASLRHLITTAAEITTDCFAAEGDAKNILDKAEQKIFAITESQITTSFQSIGKLLPQTFEDIANYSKGGVQGVPTGFKELDELTSGLQKGDLIVIAGRPSMGKTAFCLSIAQHAAVVAKFPTAIFSLEMSNAQLVQRLLCAEARINMHALRSGLLPKRDFPKLSIAAGPLSEAPLFIDDTPSISVLELRAKARRLKAQHNLACIFIDYLQLMSTTTSVENRQQEISLISRSLKGIAKELAVPVVALSQLSRAVEQRTGDHRPQLSDLRESGAIEQDADVVMFVFREELYAKDDESKKGLAEIIVGKQRNGPIGDVKLAFVREYARFENLSTRPEENIGF
ncbi:MAG: replicative DNA helicase [Chitinivibrionales bacterium]|nr:replicative DNA helicase [Chitinivibrionales bacterium]